MDTQHIVLSELEAAEILQPHLGNKSALRWLRTDRSNSPSLQYEINDNNIVYRGADVVRFVHLALNPKARFVICNNRIFNEKRQRIDRRCGIDRRSRKTAPENLLFRDRRKNSDERRAALRSERRNTLN